MLSVISSEYLREKSSVIDRMDSDLKTEFAFCQLYSLKIYVVRYLDGFSVQKRCRY